MTLVDASVWIEHFRGRPRAVALVAHLEAAQVLLHPWTLGELTLGNLGPKSSVVLADLSLLPVAPVVADSELLGFIKARGLSGRGIGWVDAQLLASAMVAGARLWSFDQKLHVAATTFAIARPAS